MNGSSGPLTAHVAARPSPTATRVPTAGSTHGAAFYVLAVLLVAALLISAWRLRRRTSGPET